ncbi:GPW/gp25 family protein [Nostoc sp. CENA67]|uniref:GPW/gp25 family protein n=1 Tax=Amazonocrinis nigriterrae CENA67 TaxID=2794033 RepID=A0A8J7LEG4_9NOST|nr:GPW/gp25 family protein [Amazonocrinis nigriterrae]MBH8566706.1 GPW/gp25 family protein [Amazonocrinis nigriterrae CENA67]
MTKLRGLAYPLQVFNGSLKLSEDYDTIRDAIFGVLETRPGERVMKQQFGCPDFIFDAVAQPQVVLSRIQVALEEQIPDIEFTVTGDIQEDGGFAVRVEWSIGEVSQPPISLILKS